MPSSPSPTPDTAIILVGGTGTRLGELTAHIPKPLLPVGGRPFVRHLIDWLARRKFKQVILATGHLAGEFEKALGSRAGELSLAYSREDSALGTGGAVAQALAVCHDPSVLVLNGDTFFPIDLAALAAVHAEQGAALSLALRRVPDAARYGRMTLENDLITNLVEKGPPGPGLINGGIYLVDRAAFLADAPVGVFSLERELFPRWISRLALAGMVSDAYFVDIGVPEDLERARRELLP